MAGMELRLALRRGENLLVTIGIPIVLLVFLASVPLLPGPAGVPAIDQLVPGILALALLSTGLVSLAIATAFERSQGVLKRLVAAPLPPWALLAAKTTAVAATAVVQVVLIALVGLVLGWQPQGGLLAGLAAALPWLILGTIAHAALGLLLAGTLRAEAVLALANALYLILLLLGGVVVPLDRLPAAVAGPASVLPPALMADLLRATLVPGGQVDPAEAIGLLAWTIFLCGAAVFAFRVEES
jgi:ABC-2 type transport system permease protein